MDLSQLLALATILLQVTFLEGILSLDNAAVLGAVVISLPADQPVPWPGRLSSLGKVLNPLLGLQRTAALRVGLLGAYVGRGMMLLMASLVIRNPWLQLVGALYLLKIAVSELGRIHQEEEESGSSEHTAARARSFWGTVLMVELMDLAFSLDNVVVVISLSNKLWLVMVGVAIGILTMRFAAGFFTKLIERMPALAMAAYVLVFNIGVEFILSRIFGLEISDGLRFMVNIGTLLFAAIYSYVPLIRKTLHFPIRAFRLFCFFLDRVFTAIFAPIGWILGKLTNLVSFFFPRGEMVAKSGD